MIKKHEQHCILLLLLLLDKPLSLKKKEEEEAETRKIETEKIKSWQFSRN